VKPLRSPYTPCILLLGASFLLSVAIGAEWIPPLRVARILLGGPWLSGDPGPEGTDATIVWSLRLPRAVLMALVGAALGGSGAAYQGLLRNPLADPYLIGVAPGAALGAAIAMVVLGPASMLGYLAVPAAAFAGGIVMVLAVYRIARVGETVPVTTLVLAGIAVGAFSNGLTTFVMLLKKGQVERLMLFLWGGVGLFEWGPIAAIAPYILGGLAVLILFARLLDVLQFGDEQAVQLGLDVERAKLLLIGAATLVAAAAVAFVGVIGFVGLVVPHVVRLVWGAGHRRLVPLSTICGAALLLGADLLQRAVPWLSRTPVGVVTAFLGAPFFVYLLRRERAEHS